MCDDHKYVCLDDLVTKAYDKCPRIHVRDATNILYANFRPDLSLSNCNLNSDFNVHQTKGIDGNCLTVSLINGIGEQTGRTPASVREEFENKCKRRDPTIVSSIVDTVVPTCNVRVVQGATNLTSCMINSMQDFVRSTHKPESYSSKPIIWGFVIFFLVIILFIITIRSDQF
jgi:hypothetical protein